MYYGYSQRALIGYRFDSNGFFGAISLEDDNFAGVAETDDNEGYIPDVVGKVGYTGGWGTVWVKAAYDENIADSIGISGFAAQLGTQINVPNMPGSSLRVIGYYSDSDNAYGTGSPLGVDSEWSILASYNQQFTETLGASVALQYFNDLYNEDTDELSGVSAWAAELSVVWFPVPQFEVRAELGYTDVDSYEDGSVSGFLRFTRYF
jgi:hypothetical protein